MLKRILAVFAIVSALAGFTVLLCLSTRYAAGQRSGLVCTGLKITIDRNGADYLRERDILRYLADSGVVLKGCTMENIEASRVESVLLKNRYVADAQVYMTRDSVFCMEIRQRDPVLKVVSTDGQLYQIDASGVVMPVNPQYQARVRVASGNIPCRPEYGLNVSALPHTDSRSLPAVLYRVNAVLASDPLWDALFEQIYVTNVGEIELIPKVGGQIVLLGKVESEDDLREKLERLRLFYEKAGGEEAWARYSRLSLKYKGQLVATRR